MKFSIYNLWLIEYFAWMVKPSRNPTYFFVYVYVLFLKANVWRYHFSCAKHMDYCFLCVLSVDMVYTAFFYCSSFCRGSVRVAREAFFQSSSGMINVSGLSTFKYAHKGKKEQTNKNLRFFSSLRQDVSPTILGAENQTNNVWRHSCCVQPCYLQHITPPVDLVLILFACTRWRKYTLNPTRMTWRKDIWCVCVLK